MSMNAQVRSYGALLRDEPLARAYVIPRLLLGAGFSQGSVALTAGAVLLVRARRNMGYSLAP